MSPPGWAPCPWFLVTPPQPARDTIDRARLTARLDDLVDRHRVTAVSAPAGYGKTTAIAHWARRSRRPVAWLSLTPFDEHPGHVLGGVCSALSRMSADLALASALSALDPDPGDLASGFRSLVAALEWLPFEVVLVLDDVHLLGTAAARGVVGLLTRQVPPTLRLVLVGRHVGRIPVQSVRAAGELGELGSGELALTEDEVWRAASALGYALDLRRAGRLADEVEGWPAAVRLALAAGGSRWPARGFRSDPSLVDFVAEEILGRLPPALAAFVLDATTSQMVDVSMASALTGQTSAGTMLEQCYELGLFLDRFTDDAAEPVYRWHAVFADQCRSVLRRRDPQRGNRLDREAARLLAAVRPLQAIVHAQRGADPTLAEEIITAHWLEIVLRSEAPALEQLCLAQPLDARDTAMLLLVRACCRSSLNDPSGATDLLSRADVEARGADTAALERFSVARGLAALLLADAHRELSQACDRVSWLLRGTTGWTPVTHAAATFLLGWIELRLRRDPPGIVRTLRAARRECRETGQRAIGLRASVNLAFALAFAGSFTAARQELDDLLPPGRGLEGWVSLESGIEWVTDGYIAYWQDDLDRAARSLRVAAGRPHAPGTSSALARAYLGLTAVANGSTEALAEAETWLHEDFSGEVNGVPWYVYTRMSRILIAMSRGHREDARALLQTIPDHPFLLVVNVQAAELLRQLGDRSAAIKRLASAFPRGHQPYASASALVTRALIARADHDIDGARTAVEKALTIAVPESIRRPFVGTDPALRALLTDHIAAGTRYQDFLADCLVRSELAVRRSGTETSAALSRREREVLAYLRTTLTTAEIAEALSLSVNTVKTHQRSVYRKLGVSGRRDAVQATIV